MMQKCKSCGDSWDTFTNEIIKNYNCPDCERDFIKDYPRIQKENKELKKQQKNIAIGKLQEVLKILDREHFCIFDYVRNCVDKDNVANEINSMIRDLKGK